MRAVGIAAWKMKKLHHHHDDAPDMSNDEVQ